MLDLLSRIRDDTVGFDNNIIKEYIVANTKRQYVLVAKVLH